MDGRVNPAVLAPVVDVVTLLRARGVPCSVDRVMVFARAVDLIGRPTLRVLHQAGRASLCASGEEQSIFDDLFEEAQLAVRDTSEEGLQEAMQLMSAAVGADPAEPPPEVKQPAVATTGARLEELDFGGLPAEAAPRLRESIRRMVRSWHRREGDGTGSRRDSGVDVAATARALVQFDGDVPALVANRRAPRPESVDIAVDLSGSMAGYAEALLEFASAFAARYPGHVRVCGFGTTFREIDGPAMVRGSPDRRRVTVDRGGTDLGRSFEELVLWRRSSGRTSRPVLIVFSDGWDAGDPDALTAALDCVRRLYQTIVWANPHVARTGYRPRQRGIVAVLPRVDHFVSGHSVDALAEILGLLARR
jgi:uncharacterized protein with von Willebrand factor type A (vWA) domain